VANLNHLFVKYEKLPFFCKKKIQLIQNETSEFFVNSCKIRKHSNYPNLSDKKAAAGRDLCQPETSMNGEL